MYIPLTFEGSQAKCLFASGGIEGYFTVGSQQWKYHQFTSSADLIVQKGTIDGVEIYVIGGGGAGGNRNTSIGGGGGGGGGVNYTMNGRLFQGAYSVAVGRGGYAIAAENSNGLNGVTSSLIGSGINMIAGGGGGGIGLDASTGGTGGQPNGGNGGAGGSTSAVNGNAGVTIYLDEYGWGYGCGGGGASNLANPGDQGFSCNDTQFGDGANGTNFAGAGANRYGMGGGGGNQTSSSADGGSGSVIIKYRIYDYCSNYFHETGSCGCREIILDASDPVNYTPYETGSFMYMPCGETQFVSGSLSAYAPFTVCAVSNSYFAYTKINEGPDPDVVVLTTGFVNSTFLPTAPECVSASLTPTPCSIESFVPTCTSSIVTVYTPFGDTNNNEFYYVAKNETTHSLYSTNQARVKYICVSTGSSYGNGIPIYPKINSTGTAVLYDTASCNTITINAPGTGRGVIYNCNGVKQTLINPGTGNTFCIDTTIGVQAVSGFSLFNYSVGGTCLSGSFDTSSCGCP